MTWADYQAYLIEKAGGNSPDPDAFAAEVNALTGWDDIDLEAAPWNLMFSTIGLSTWEEFQAGEVKELAQKIAKQIETDLRYPGRIKLTMIRETRIIEYAR